MPNGRPIRSPGLSRRCGCRCSPLAHHCLVQPDAQSSAQALMVRAAGPPADATRAPGAQTVVTVTYSAVMSLTEPTIIGALSPSRAGDFMTCPLLYRFRVIDRLPEPPSPAAVRGTMVHSVLERLFDLPAAERTVAARPGPAGAAVGAAASRGARATPTLFTGDEDARRVAGPGPRHAGALLHPRGPAPAWSPPSGSSTWRRCSAVGPDAARLHRPGGRGAQR